MRNIHEAASSLSQRLWMTPWCVGIAASGTKLVIAAVAGTAPPMRKSRKLRSWRGFPVVFETGQQELFNEIPTNESNARHC